jgi:hypothetical protein
MNDRPIPADVHNFILRHIDTIAQLEALLLLRSDPEMRWNAKEIAKRIYTSEQEAEGLLIRLAQDGLLQEAGDLYWYACNDPMERRLVDRLADVYSRHLIPVTNLIHGKPRRIRQFADAFKFRKDR